MERLPIDPALPHRGVARTRCGVRARALLLAVALCLFGAQLAYTNHEYTHIKAPSTLRVCQYCVAGTHMQSLPPADILRLPADARFEQPRRDAFVRVADASPQTVNSRGPPPTRLPS